MPTFEALDTAQLVDVNGGLPNGIQPQPQPAEPKTWVEGLNRSLRDRGYDPNIDPGGTRQPPNPGMDPKIEKPWDPFAAPNGGADL
jgi:hypothetical protein